MPVTNRYYHELSRCDIIEKMIPERCHIRCSQISYSNPFPACLQKCSRVQLPPLLVEIDREEPTSLFGQQRINTDRVLSREMCAYNLVRQWPKFPGLAGALFSIFQFASEAGDASLDF